MAKIIASGSLRPILFLLHTDPISIAPDNKKVTVLKDGHPAVNEPKMTKFTTCLEAPPRIELGNKGFADLCLTAWLWRHVLLFIWQECENIPAIFCGADDEARTRYLHLGKVALYQMSYTCKRRIIL